jgi:hypothetical protein
LLTAAPQLSDAMTEELAIGHYFKRLTAVQYECGSTDYHVTRYAKTHSRLTRLGGTKPDQARVICFCA